MKKLILFLIIVFCIFCTGCIKDNTDILLQCNDPVIVSNPTWEGQIPINKNYISKSLITDDYIYIFYKSDQKEKLVYFNKLTKESKTFDIENSYESLLYDKTLYFIYYNDNGGHSIGKLDLTTNETITIVEESNGSRIRSLQILDDGLFYLISYPQSSFIAKIKRADLKAGFTTSEIHTNKNNEYKSYIRDAYVWHNENGSYNITYIHIDPKLVVSTYHQMYQNPIYVLPFSNDNGFTVFNNLGKNSDLYLSYNENTRKTMVIDLNTGKIKFESPGLFYPMNNKYAFDHNILIDAQNGNLIIDKNNKSKVLFENDELVYMHVIDSKRISSIRALDLNTNCFVTAYDHKTSNHVFLDSFNNEMIVIDPDSNTILAYKL